MEVSLSRDALPIKTLLGVLLFVGRSLDNRVVIDVIEYPQCIIHFSGLILMFL